MPERPTTHSSSPQRRIERKPAPIVQLSSLNITSSSLSLTLDSSKGSLKQQIQALTTRKDDKMPPRPALFPDSDKPLFEGFSDFPPTPGLSSPPLSPYTGGSPPRPKEESRVPISTSSSIFLHKGFWDLLGLAQASGHTLSKLAASSPLLGGWDQTGGYNAAKAFQPPSPVLRQLPLISATNGIQRKRISVDMISKPMGFA
jgi:hypothetical protein